LGAGSALGFLLSLAIVFPNAGLILCLLGERSPD
jgi:hypothetical protein